MAATQQALLMASDNAVTVPEACEADPYYSCVEGAAGRTILSLHAEDTTDSSCYQPKTVTLAGTASVTDIAQKFGTYSFAVPNTGSSTANGVVITDHQDLDFGTGDFTIEMWAYRSANTYAGTLFYYTETAAFSLVVETTGLVTLNYCSSGGTQASIATGVTFPLTTWQHVVVQRRGTDFEFYLNGVLSNTTAITGGASSTVNSTGDFYLGRTNASSALSWNGYIDEARVTKGVARIDATVASFTPNTNTYPVTIGDDPHYSDVALLLELDNTYTDAGPGANIITINRGTPTFVTDFSIGSHAVEETEPFGLSATLPSVPADRSFTLEFWYKRTGIGNYCGFCGFNGSLGPWIALRTPINSGTYQFGVLGITLAEPTSFFTTESVPLNTWTHLAISYSAIGASGILRLFFNGVLSRQTMRAITPSAAIDIGRTDSSGFSGLNGILDSYRLTLGVARYTSDFDPATQPNCDSVVPGNAVAIPGTSPLTGMAVAVQQQPIGSQDGTVGLTNNFIDIGPPLTFRINRADVFAGTLTVSSVATDKTVALTGRGLTVFRGTVAVPPYPDLTTTSITTIEIPPTAGTARLTARFFTDGTFVARDQNNAVRINTTWIDTTQTDYDIASISSQYRIIAINVFLGPILKYTYTVPPVTLGSAYSIVIANSDAGITNVFEFQVTIGPTTNNPRYGETYYYGTHRVKASLGGIIA